MAKHETHKATAQGKAATIERKQAKARKYAEAPSLSETARALNVRVVA